ncbi:hypothetical protein U1Q18_025605 [Sarracenia purpurea var. burkii]
MYRGEGFLSVCLRRDRRSQASRSSPSLGECFEMVLIYVDNEFGEWISPFLSDALQDTNARIPYRSVIPPFASNDRIVFAKAKEVGMMSEGYVWIVTDAVANALGLLDPSAIDSMQGVLGVEPGRDQWSSRLDSASGGRPGWTWFGARRAVVVQADLGSGLTELWSSLFISGQRGRGLQAIRATIGVRPLNICPAIVVTDS